MKNGPADCQRSSRCGELTLPGGASKNKGCGVHCGRVACGRTGASNQVFESFHCKRRTLHCCCCCDERRSARDVGGKNDVELLSPDALSCLLLPLLSIDSSTTASVPIQHQIHNKTIKMAMPGGMPMVVMSKSIGLYKAAAYCSQTPAQSASRGEKLKPPTLSLPRYVTCVIQLQRC